MKLEFFREGVVGDDAVEAGYSDLFVAFFRGVGWERRYLDLMGQGREGEAEAEDLIEDAAERFLVIMETLLGAVPPVTDAWLIEDYASREGK